MPQVNLSTLSGPELRQMLDASRRRGEAKLAYQILQEMAARRDARPERNGARGMLRPAEPRIIDIDLGDPMDPKDDVPPMPGWRAPVAEPQAAKPPAPVSEPPKRNARRGKPAPAPTLADAMAAGVAGLDVEPAAPSVEPQPRGVWNDDPEPLEVPSPRPVRGRRAPGGLGRGLAAGFVAGAAAGVALGWWFGAESDVLSAAIAPTGPVEIAALASPSTPPTVAPAPAAPEPPAAPAAALSVELAPPDTAAAPAVETEAAPIEAVEPGRPAEAPQLAVARAASAPSDACAAEPTPADRQICSDEELRRLQQALRQAYAEALEAHQDRALLRQRQLAWRTARDPISDPVRLAELYAQRIRKLDAATAEARQLR
ncbi:hypothetical protein [uncultured Phenylobacterium sp.]|uniref:hypothetical protein n=1 Tax=uncultured Phenylobacterium sp. TaxID=349273 RepID=UPI0025ED2017|nr:hypothetical protein [uncultured Phenylobacterium sp.]